MSKVDRLNVNGYSDKNKIPRSTTRDRVRKLARLGLAEDNYAEKKITKQGLIYLENTNQVEKKGVGNSRQGGRKNQLSTHWHKFSIPIKDRSKFIREKLERILNTENIIDNKLPNLHQIIITLEDAKIIINPKQVKINLLDYVSDDIEESDMSYLPRVVEYIEKLKKTGLELDTLNVEEKGHWARIESVLADFLYKIDERYYLELSDGSKLWIDHSPDKYGNRKAEDETNNKIVRERVDSHLNRIGTGEIDLSDIDKIKESLGFITKLESTRLMDKIEESKLMRLKLEKNNVENKIGVTELNLTPGYIQ